MSAAIRLVKIRDENWTPPKNGEWTVDDFMRLENPPGYFYEMIQGVLHMSPAPSLPHQRALRNLFRKLDGFVEKHKLGEVLMAPLDVVLAGDGEQTVVEPDIIFVSKARKSILAGEANIQGTPDLLVEVVSPGSHLRDTREKFELYLKHGVNEYWIVDPSRRTIAVWVRREDSFVLMGRPKSGKRVVSELLKGFAVDLSSVFKG